MITYNDLYEASRKERYSEQLQALPKNFIQEVSDYMKDKKEMASKEDDIFSDVIMKSKKQLENALIIFKELILRRKKKLLTLILIATETGISKQDFDNMLPFEKELFEDLMKCMDSSEKRLQEILLGKINSDSRNELILFKEDVEEFVGMEGEKMGPFEKGQVANISKEIAKILVDDGKAEVMEE